MNNFLKILFVEDVEDDSQMLLRELRKGGYQITHKRVETADEMLTALETEVFDLVVADYKLPNFSGPEALKLLKVINVDIPFITVSGSIGEDNAVEILKQGAHDFITKTNLSRLIPAIERSIGDSNLRKQKKATEIALHQSEEQYRMLFETAKDGLFLFLYTKGKEASNFIRVNSAACKMLGYTNEELMNLSPKDLEPLEMWSELPLLFDIIFDQNELSVERVLVRKDKTHFFVEISANPLVTKDGNAILATVRDITQRKQSEKTLYDSELKYRLLFENNPQPMWVYDLETLRFLSVNNAAVARYGYSHEEFFSMTLLDIRPTEDARKLLKNISESFEELQKSGIWQHKKKDGSIIFVEIYSHSFIFEGRNARLVLANDVTDRKLSEDALRESEKRYRALFDSSPISLWEEDFTEIKQYIDSLKAEGITDFDNYFDEHPHELIKCISRLKILDLNEATLKLYKAEGKDELLTGLERTTGLDTLKDFKKSVMAVVQNKLDFYTETENFTLDGEKLFVAISWKVLPGFEQNYGRAIVSIADLTDRKKAEIALKQQAEILEKIFENIPVMISFYDSTGKLITVNREFECVLGWNRQELVKVDLLKECFPDVDTRKDVLQFMINKPPGWQDFKTRTRHGKDIYTSWANVQLSDQSSFGIGQDITERKFAEEEIKTTNEELKILNKVILESASFLDIQHILEIALDEALRISNLEGGTICLINPDDTLSLAAHRAASQATISDLSSNKIKVGDCLCGKCAAEKCPLILRTPDEVLRYSTREVARGEDIRFHAAFPIIIKDKTLGVLCVFTRTDAKPTERSLKLLETITSQMSLSLENAKLYEHSQSQVAALQNLTERYRLLTERLRTAREDERIEIAREIHDELGQVLTALKIDLTLFQNKLPKRNVVLKSDIDEIITLVDSIIKTVQKISTELRPAVLDDLGLNAAIEWQVLEFQNRTEIICDISKVEDIGKLERHTATALFRIFQEALTNIVRHSAASRVEIVMKQIDTDIFLEIHDNGRGVAKEEIDDKNSIGILGMKERAIALGGEFTISGSPGEGSVVTVRIPA